MNGLFDLACGLARASAVDHGIPMVGYEGDFQPAEPIAIGHWIYAFYPNECSRYHAPVTFKSEQCPACRAHRLCNRLENRLDRALETIETLESEIADLKDGVDRV